MPKIDYVYAISKEAKADLDDIWLYTAQQWSIEQADTYYNEIITAFENLASGHLVWEKADHIFPGYCKYKIGSHIIFFKPKADCLEIIRILHGRMDIQNRLANKR